MARIIAGVSRRTGGGVGLTALPGLDLFRLIAPGAAAGNLPAAGLPSSGLLAAFGLPASGLLTLGLLTLGLLTLGLLALGLLALGLLALGNEGFDLALVIGRGSAGRKANRAAKCTVCRGVLSACSALRPLSPAQTG